MCCLTILRCRQDLLPFYARLAAALQPIIPDVAIILSNKLKQEFKFQVRKKYQLNLEHKLKVGFVRIFFLLIWDQAEFFLVFNQSVKCVITIQIWFNLEHKLKVGIF